MEPSALDLVDDVRALTETIESVRDVFGMHLESMEVRATDGCIAARVVSLALTRAPSAWRRSL